jgi:hypothetical protein
MIDVHPEPKQTMMAILCYNAHTTSKIAHLHRVQGLREPAPSSEQFLLSNLPQRCLSGGQQDVLLRTHLANSCLSLIAL